MSIFRIATLLLFLFALILPITVMAEPVPNPPDPNTHYLVYSWEDKILAHSLSGTGEIRGLGLDFPGAENAFQPYLWDVYDLSRSPLTAPPADDFGFQHGIWSPDKTRFVYLVIKAPTYRLYLLVDGVSTLLMENTLNPAQGYLDPLGWNTDGSLLLSERPMLHHLDSLRVWQLNMTTYQLSPYANAGLASVNQHQVRGNSMITSGGAGAILGVELETGAAYYFDFATRTMTTFPTLILLPNPPGSVFNLYPLDIIAVVSGSDLTLIEPTIQTQVVQPTIFPDPFLHWFAPNSTRRVTCYPDSAWTQAHFAVNCPSLHVDYDGHQGTDVSGPVGGSGLPIGTGVYAAAPGVVVKIHNTCQPNNPSCGQAYGNIVTLEHTIVVNGSAQTWYTGYAHLSEVLVAPYQFISDITAPIGKSGSTGTGGPHIHFEVRSQDVMGWIGWLDPWDSTYSGTERNLWIGTNEMPVAAEIGQTGQ